ncbi:MAG: DUF2017 family protein [Actinomycetota bacterium]
MGPFARRRGGLRMRLGEGEAELLGRVVHELRGEVESPERSPHLRRLFPPAYPDDDESQREFARLTGDDLVAQKRAALDDVERALQRGHVRRGVWSTDLSHDEVSSMLGFLNDARLTLGTRLDVTEDMAETSIDPHDPDAPAHVAYRYLGWLQSFLVDELLA